MSKYQALIDAIASGKESAFEIAADWHTIRSLLADLEMAEKALKVARSYIARYGYTGEQLAAIDAAISQISGGGER